ncbi:gallidermin/nisin family lantibiotic [Bacillus sp. NPDC057893]|uniref:gallidermin/nisin family lantibiotic n=1 Tax=Bacillus sp. NPDC057893 TaxID=3346273 RepID=UPI003672E942
MGKKDLFDLDFQIKQSNSAVEPRITSAKYCTPGTCWASCKGDATLHSNCCLSLMKC